MSLVLDLPAELETELAAEAARLRLPLPEYVLRLLASGRTPTPAPCTGRNSTRTMPWMGRYWPISSTRLANRQSTRTRCSPASSES